MPPSLHWNIYLSGKINVRQNVQNSGGRHLDVCTVDILISTCSEFYEEFFGSKIFWFGGQFRELESPKVWLMAEIFIFEGHKHAKSLQLIKRFPAMFSEISYLISA